MKTQNVFFFFAFFFFALLWGGAAETQAAQCTAAEAREMVEGWLALSRNAPLQERLSGMIGAEEAITQADGTVVGYLFNLRPEGFVVVSADDAVEPVIAFSSRGRDALAPEGPLAALVAQDLPARLAFARSRQRGGQGVPAETEKWARYRAEASGGMTRGNGLADLPDLRVAPLMRSSWNQGQVNNTRNCYNYYTPNNWVCGCVSTSWGQIMRYHRHPATGIGVITRTILVNGLSRSASTRGGDGAGGPYQWDLMPLTPHAGHTEAQLQAVGALTCDIGVAISVGPAGSGTITEYIEPNLTSSYMPPHIMQDVFNYASTFRFDGGVDRERAINTNLDAGMPVNVALYGHAVVCDGYGFQGGTAFHHLNMGWGGLDDAWYTLGAPITTTYYIFNGFDYIYANISPGTVGEIVSGRVLDAGGQPIANATVTLTPGNRTAHSDGNGIYAFTGLPANTAHTLTAQKDGYTFSPLTVTTGQSQSYGTSCGNRWGNTLTGTLSGGYTLASGNVANPDGIPVPGITVAFSSGGGAALTDANGNFRHALPLGWTGTAGPSLAQGYSDPAQYVLGNLNAPLSGLDFEVTRMAFVNAAATGDGSGTSWQNAYTTLTAAIENTPAVMEIWVAKSTYTPNEGHRMSAFYVAPGQKTFGGFNGTETRREQRDWIANPTLLSGDIGTKGIATDNCYNVIRGAAGARVDGFIITGGYADDYVNGTHPIDVFARGRGAAAFIWDNPSTDDTSFLLNHCVVSNNYAAGQGSALFRCLVRNSLVTANNSASVSGSGFAVGNGSTFENCTITGNTSYLSPVLLGTAKNCIIYGNAAVGGASFYTSAVTATFCCHDIPSGSLVSGSGNNITSNPLLQSGLPALPFIIATNSPCVNAGTMLPWMDTQAVDFFGDPRVSGIAPDIGAYEIQATHPPLLITKPAGGGLLSPSGFSVAFKTRYGWRYTLKTSTDLINWTPVAALSNIPGNGSMMTFIDPDTSVPKKFYRVESAK